MSRRATLGQFMVNKLLPEDLQDYQRVWDKGGMTTLLRSLAEKHPDKYREVLHNLTQVAREAATATGGHSFGLQHLRMANVAKQSRLKLKQQMRQILDDDNLDDDTREERILAATRKMKEGEDEAIYQESLKEENPLAYQVLSGSRGNKGNLASLRGSDALYVDHRERTIPVPVLHSYSQGLSPLEYWAGSYGARKGVLATKMATADAGYFCLEENTLVRMGDWSTKPIKDIVVGDIVLGADKTGKTFPVPVTAIFDNGQRECWRYRFRYGKSRTEYLQLTATAQHRALALRKVGRNSPRTITTPTLLPLGQAGDGFSLYPTTEHMSPGVKEPRALILGLLLGDGGLTGNSCYFSVADEGLLTAVNQYLNTMDYRLDKVSNHPYEYILRDCLRVGQGHRHRLITWLRELGVFGKYAHEKSLPDCVWTWDNESVAALLAGLFATDGCITKSNNSSVPVIVMALTSQKLVQQTRELLAQRFGIYASVVRTKAPKTSSRVSAAVGYLVVGRHDVHTFVLNDEQSVRKFAGLIRMPGKKQQTLDTALLTTAPATRDNRFGYHFVDKTYMGPLPTRDLEVDHPDHLFVLANGAIVSNSKQLSQAAHRLLVSELDSDKEPEGVLGLPVSVDDDDSEGALLAAPVGGYQRNTVLTPKILRELRDKGMKRILVRSPAVGGPPDGGLYARDAGVREKGGLPPRGEMVGLIAASALGEPLSQGMLSAKHSGGVAGANKSVGGFQYINSLVQTPKVFPGGATHAETDGTIERIAEAPAGGYHVYVHNQEHYVPADLPLKVKKGQWVEAGDVLSEGIPNPGTIVQHKGIGEGRRYFIDSFRDAYKSAGVKASRRNIEVLSKGLINHVRLNSEFGDYVPDDVIPYSLIERDYQPRTGAAVRPIPQAIGKYLERPYLHYTIGTKVRPSMLKDFQEFGVKDVEVHDDPPPFDPEMQRGMTNLQHDPDWMTQMYGSGLKGSLLESAQRGATSDAAGTSFVPGLAKAVDFGTTGKVQTPRSQTWQEPPQT